MFFMVFFSVIAIYSWIEEKIMYDISLSNSVIFF